MKKNFTFCNKNVFVAAFSLSRNDKETFNRRVMALQELSSASLSTGYLAENNDETALLYVSDCKTISEFLNWLQSSLEDKSGCDGTNRPSISFADEE